MASRVVRLPDAAELDLGGGGHVGKYSIPGKTSKFWRQGWVRENVFMIDMDAGVSGTKKIRERKGMSTLYDLIETGQIGLVAAQMISMALVKRARSGAGSAIEIPMFENLAKFVLEEHMYLQTFEPPLGPTGDPRLLDPLGKPIPTSDGWICISANTNEQAFAFFSAIGRPELRDDPRFSTVPARFANVSAFFELRAQALRARSTAHWIEVFERHDVPAMPYNSLEDLLEDPHLNDVGFFELKDHPTEGKIRNMRLPNKWSGGARADWTPAPKLGQHSVEVLREAGLTSAEIGRLIAAGATIDGQLHES